MGVTWAEFQLSSGGGMKTRTLRQLARDLALRTAIGGLLVSVGTLLGGCRVHVGTNHLLFVSKANSGVDVDSMPAEVQLSLFGHSDVVLGPTFERAQNAPVIAGFRRSNDLGDGWPFAGSTVATGPAAMVIAMMVTDTGNPPVPDAYADLGRYVEMSDVRLSQPPQVDDRNQQMFVQGEAPPTWFSISEGVGIALELHGPSYPLPQSVHAGYRRKEALVVPLSMSLDEQAGENNSNVLIHTPSVLNVTKLVRVRDGDDAHRCRCHCHKRLRPRRVKHKRVQLFATGAAATRLATNERIQNAMLEGFVDEPDCSCKKRPCRHEAKSKEGKEDENPDP